MFLSRWSWRDLGDAAALALAFLFGLQLLRSLLTSLIFYLGEVRDASSVTLGLYAFALFLAPFLATPVRRFLGPQRAVPLAAGGTALLRAAEQLVSSPAVELAVATVGTSLFLLFIALSAGALRGRGAQAGGLFALGMLLGLAADTALRGSLGTLDLSWRHEAWATAVVLFLAGLQLALLGRGLGVAQPPQPSVDSEKGGTPLPLLVLGPALVLEMLLFQNIGQQTVRTGWEQPAVLAWMALANVVGIAVGAAAIAWRGNALLTTAGLLGALLLAAVVWGPSGAVAGGVILVGQAAVALSLTLAWMALGAGRWRGAWVGPTPAVGVGLMLMMLLLFGYYSVYDLATSLPNSVVAPLASGLLLAGALGAARSLSGAPGPAPGVPWVSPLAAALLLVQPGAYWLSWDEAEASPGAGLPVRIMTYNLHQGFNIAGDMALEEMAEVIEEEGVDIVALQEVSRAWVVTGSVDMLVWLSQRLAMPYVWGPASDDVWGNAVLSRYPLSGAETRAMPNNDELILQRSYTTVMADLGAGESLRIIATHLHSWRQDSDKRIPQIQAVLEAWGGAPGTVILGDLNAEPDAPEMQLLRDAGLVDAFVAAEAQGPGTTTLSGTPPRRIDYIWITEDLEASDFSTGESRASDHRPVTVTVGR